MTGVATGQQNADDLAIEIGYIVFKQIVTDESAAVGVMLLDIRNVVYGRYPRCINFLCVLQAEPSS